VQQTNAAAIHMIITSKHITTAVYK